MSKTHKSAEVARKDPARKPSNTGAVFKPVTFDVVEKVKAGDVIQMVRVPKEVTVFSAAVCVQRAGGDVLRLNLGDDQDPKRYISGGVITRKGGRVDAAGAGSVCDYGEAATIDITVAEGVLEVGDTVRAVVGYVAP